MSTGIYPRKSPSDRFWERVDKRGPIPAHRPELGPCWVWTGGMHNAGYGYLSACGSKVLAHRFVYELVVGPIPEGLDIDHECHNGSGCLGGTSCPHRMCVNPMHLAPATRSANVLRGVGSPATNARKTHCKRGHEFTPENIYTHPGRPNHRECAICMREAEAARPPRLGRSKRQGIQ
jgi:HNH endonuclease